MKSSLNSLRRLGKVMYIGCLSIHPNYRHRPELLIGLFKSFIDLALYKDISFIVSESFSSKLPVYIKLGFSALYKSSDPRYRYISEGHVCHPVYLNFAKMIFHKGEAVDEKYGFSKVINKYLLERWYKRSAIRNIFRKEVYWPWNFDSKKFEIF